MATARAVVARNFARREGWFKVWRKMFSNDIWLTCPDSWLRVFIALLGCAQYDDTTITVGTEALLVPAGSLVIGSDEFSTFCNVSRQQLRSALWYLKGTNVITTTPTTRYTVVNITNWASYQSADSLDNQHPNQVVGENGNHNKRSKEVKNYTHPIVERYAIALHARHPQERKGSLGVIRKHLTAIVKPLAEDRWEDRLAFIDANHVSMCESHDWTKEDGQYAKGLEGWLAPTMGRFESGAPKAKAIQPRLIL